MAANSRQRHRPPVGEEDLRRRRLPILVGRSARLVWVAGGADAVVALGMGFIQGLGVLVLLVQISRLLERLVRAENVGAGGSIGGLATSVLPVVLANSLILLAGILVNNRQHLLAEKVQAHVTSLVLEIACLGELDDFDDPGFHDRLQRAARSTLGQPMLLIQSLMDGTQASFMMLGVVGALSIIQPVLGLLALLAIVPIWFGGVRSGGHHYQFVVETTQSDRRRQYLVELMTSREAVKELRAFDLGGLLGRRWQDLTDQRLERLAVTMRSRFKAAALAALGGNFVIAGVAGVFIVLNRVGFMSLAETATAAGALLVLSQKLTDTIRATNDFFEAAPLVQDLDEFLALRPSLEEARGALPPPEAFEEIAVDEATFAYKGASRPAIDGVSLTIRAGEVIALVGENGSGKSTLAKLIAGLYPVDCGRITVDGVDLGDFDPAGWRGSTAVVFQDFAQYALAARDNIAVGRATREPDEEAIRDAARAAGADGFLAALPAGYDTVLSPEFDDGQDLSLGQWQRVALARAFYRSAPLVILDEPTSSLDARAERALFETVRDLYRNRTVLLISHRFSTVLTADRIIVLAGGRVVEQGTHAGLLASGGLYSELFQLQASHFTVPDDQRAGDGHRRGDGAADPSCATGGGTQEDRTTVG